MVHVPSLARSTNRVQNRLTGLTENRAKPDFFEKREQVSAKKYIPYYYLQSEFWELLFATMVFRFFNWDFSVVFCF